MLWISHVYAQYVITTEQDIYKLYNQGEINQQEKDRLLYLLKNPVNLNTASFNQLLLLPGMTPSFAKRIIQYRKSHGKYTSISDLKLFIPAKLLIQWEPFIKPIPGYKFNYEIKYDTELNDSNYRIYSRFLLHNKEYSLGLSSAYDKSEYYSKEILKKYFFQYHGRALIRDIILGNYKAKFGSGVTINNAWQNVDDGFYPDTGLQRKFYGMGITIQPFKSALFSYMYSMPLWYMKSRYQEYIYGGNIRYKINRYTSVGITWYNAQLVLHDDSTYISWYKGDNILTGYGINFNLSLDRHLLSSEITRVKSGSYGGIFRILSYYPYITGVFIYRYYEPDFINPYSSSFSASDDEPDNTDERGIYIKMRYKLSNNAVISGYYDLWTHPSTYISGAEQNLSIVYNISKHLKCRLLRTWKFEDIDISGRTKNVVKFYIKPRPEWKLTLISTENKYKFVEDRSVIMYLSYKFMKILSLDSRVERKEYLDDDYTKLEYYIQPGIFFKNGVFLVRYTYQTYTDNNYKDTDIILVKLKLFW